MNGMGLDKSMEKSIGLGQNSKSRENKANILKGNK